VVNDLQDRREKGVPKRTRSIHVAEECSVRDSDLGNEGGTLWEENGSRNSEREAQGPGQKE